MTEALQLWKNGKSVYAAAKMTSVPIQTLRDRSLGKINENTTNSGPPSKIGIANEKILLNTLQKWRDMAMAIQKQMFVY